MNPAHREYEPFELAENMEEDLGMFEAAAKARPIELPPLDVRCVLLAPDGSNQDATARAAARLLAERLSAEVVERAGLASSAAICEAAVSAGAGLVVAPAPFGEDIDLLKSRSLGSVIDALLLESPAPLLCVREPMPENELDLLSRAALVPFTEDSEDAERALAWACRLAAGGRRLAILELPDGAAVVEAREMAQGADEMQSVRRATLGRAMSGRLGALVATAQHRASSQNFSVQVEFRSGAPVAEVLAWQARNGAALLVVGRSREATSAQYHRAVDLLKASRGPVLLT